MCIIRSSCTETRAKLLHLLGCKTMAMTLSPWLLYIGGCTSSRKVDTHCEMCSQDRGGEGEREREREAEGERERERKMDSEY